MIAQAAGASLGPSASKHFPVSSGGASHPSWQFFADGAEDIGEDHDPEGGEDEEDAESEDLQDDEIYLEDREYEEDEAIFLQAYHTAYSDVRKDMRDRRRERALSSTTSQAHPHPPRRGVIMGDIDHPKEKAEGSVSARFPSTFGELQKIFRAGQDASTARS